MATSFDATPTWFEADFYLDTKLATMIAEDPKGNWTRPSMLEAFAVADFANPYDHYLAYGDSEGLSPNSLFNNAEYLAAKTALMGSTWTSEMVAKAIADAGLTLMQHYLQFGSTEGLSPSSAFNQDKYYEAKLEQVQTDEPGKGWTLESLKAAFATAGLTPLEHYLGYAKAEGLDKHDYSDNGAPIPHPGNNIVLTADADTVTPEATDAAFRTSGKDDMISAVVGNTGKSTLTSGDVIDGGAGMDTLTVDLQASFTHKSGSIKNVEHIVLNAGKGTVAFDAAGVEGAGIFAVNGVTDSKVTINNVATTDPGYALKMEKGDFTAKIQDSALTGKADNVYLTLNGVGTDASNRLNVAVQAVKTGDVETVSLVAQNKDNFLNLTQGHENINVWGAGNVDVIVAKTGLKKFDASDAAGKITADLSAASGSLKTITGGNNDDNFTVGTAALASTVFEGGNGDDTLTFIANPTAAAKPTISGFEKIVLKDGASDLNGTNVSGVSEILLDNNSTPIVANITKWAGDDLTLSTKGDAGAVAYDGKGTLTFRNVDANNTIGDANVTSLAANAVETLNITNADTEGTDGLLDITTLDAKLATTLNVNTGEYGVTVAGGDLRSVETITVTGDGLFTFSGSGTSSKLAEINATGLGGVLTVTLGTGSAGVKVFGGTDDDTIITAASSFLAELTGGAGDDIFNVANTMTKFAATSDIGASSTVSSKMVIITDFEKGDSIAFSATAHTGGNAIVHTGHGTDVAGPADVEAALVTAIKVANSTPGNFNWTWFTDTVDTYVVWNTGTTTAVDQDIVVKLNGVKDLTSAAVDANGLLTWA